MMKKMRDANRRPSFGRDQFGATAIEYSIIAALISVAAYVAMVDVGEATDAMFTKAVDAFPD